MRHSFSAGSGFFAVAAAVFLAWPTAASAQLGGTPYVDPRVLDLEIKCNKLQDTINKLEGVVGDLLTRLACVSRQTGEINGVSGPHLLITGCNVHIRSGSGMTGDTTNLGNLIIGYNEPRNTTDTTNRTGSHTLIIGPEHQFTASGGLLAGYRSTVTADFASVSGGRDNTASGNAASVSGGVTNAASGFVASVSGGTSNTASGDAASVSGGAGNMASGPQASVSGGELNTASGDFASVSGGQSNTASGFVASVSGGRQNTASGNVASVSGGALNTASANDASVSGGGANTASGAIASVSGGELNTASGFAASVSGGKSRAASGTDDWVAGGLFQDF